MYTGNLIGGRYRVTRRIGAGAIGVVWEAEDTQSERRVALKQVLHAAPEHQRRLLKEARVCQRLSHPNIIEVLDVGETDRGFPFLVMPLLSGETIAEMLVRKRKLAVPLAARIARDIANALAAAHGQGIIHRDLKPANVFIHRADKAESPIVKVLDFGVCKDSNAKTTILTAQGHVIGSPAYMSPEQVKGAELDPRTDIWSLGVVLFEMITGVRPFRGQGVVELFVNILGAEIPTISQLVRTAPAGLANLVSACLTRDREQRIGTAREVADLLEEYVSEDGTSTLTETSCHLIDRVLGDVAGAAGRGSPAPSAPSALNTPNARNGSHVQANEAGAPSATTTTPLPHRASIAVRPAPLSAGRTEVLQPASRSLGARKPSGEAEEHEPKRSVEGGASALTGIAETLAIPTNGPSPAPQARARAADMSPAAGAKAAPGTSPRGSAGEPAERASRGANGPLRIARGGTVEMARPTVNVAGVERAGAAGSSLARAAVLLPPGELKLGSSAAVDSDSALAMPGETPMDLPRSTWLAIGAGAIALALMSLGFASTFPAPVEAEAGPVRLDEPPILKSPPRIALPAPAEAAELPAPPEPPSQVEAPPAKKSAAAPANRAASSPIREPSASASAAQVRPASTTAGRPQSPPPKSAPKTSPPSAPASSPPGKPKRIEMIGGSKAPF